MIDKSDFCISQLIVYGKQNGNSIAINAIGRKPLTYHLLREQIIKTVECLNEIGYGRNDRFLLILPDGPELAVAYLAIAAGFTCVPISYSTPIEEIKSYLTHFNIKAIVTVSDKKITFGEIARSFNVPILYLEPLTDQEAGRFILKGDRGAGTSLKIGYATPDDLAVILSTSGTTTSVSKIVPLTQMNICSSVLKFISAYQLTENDCNLNVIPMYHSMGLNSALLAAIVSGGSIVCAPELDLNKFMGWMHHYMPSWYTAVPAVHHQIVELAKKDKNAGSVPLRFIRNSGGVLPATMRQDLEIIFQTVVIESYGMTECPIISSNPMPPGLRKPGSSGIAVALDIAIFDDYGTIKKTGEIGEVCVKGSQVFTGYENNPDANRECFIDGWFRTGDIGYIDNEGYIYITGRKKELINLGGEKISPYKVEEVLLKHPGIVEAAAFPVPSDILGEEMGVAVVLKSDNHLTPDEIRKFTAKYLQFTQVPTYVVIVNEIPKVGVTSKIRRNELHKTYKSVIDNMKNNFTERSKENRPISSEVTVKKLITIWGHVLDREVDADTDFFAYGGNSLKAAYIFTAIEKEFGVKLSINVMFESPTIAQMAELISDHIRHMDNDRADKKVANIWDMLIPLQPHGNRSPLFCIHGLNGNVMHYKYIIQHLDKDLPVYGIQPPENPNDEDVKSIEALALYYISIIKAIQPTGQYNLLGHSFSGGVAYEMARKLTEKGDKILFLGIIDTPSHGHWNVSRIYNLKFIMNFTKEIPSMFIQFIRSDNKQKHINISRVVRTLRMISPVPFNALQRFIISEKELYPEFIYNNPEGYLRENAIRNHVISRNYIPGRYAGKLTLFAAASKKDVGYIYSLVYPSMGWDQFAGEVETVYVDGDHNTIMDASCSVTIAEKINQSICVDESSSTPLKTGRIPISRVTSNPIIKK